MKKISVLTVVLALASFGFAQSNTTETNSSSQETKTVQPVVETTKVGPKKQFNTDAIQHKEAIKIQDKKEIVAEPKNSRLNATEDERTPSDSGSRD
jgi:uncharacterized protein YcfJ